MSLARFSTAALLSTAALTLLAGCGGDDDGQPAGTAVGAPGRPAATPAATTAAIKHGLPSVVAVIVGTGDGALTGTGTVVGSDVVITDSTLVADASGASKAGVTIRTADGDEHPGVVDGVDALTGLAAVRVRGIDNLPAAARGSAPTLGAPVTALGVISGRRTAVRPGTIVEFGRSVRSGGIAEADLFAASATLGVQGVGGPLVDDAGRVVGIVTRALTSLIPGAATALPMPAATRIAQALRDGGRVRRAYLGLEVVAVTPPRATELRLTTSTGLLVSGTAPGSPASFAGFKAPTGTDEIGGREIPTGGDVVVRVDGIRLAQSEDLDAALALIKPGHIAKFTVIRGDKSVTVSVRLGER